MWEPDPNGPHSKLDKFHKNGQISPILPSLQPSMLLQLLFATLRIPRFILTAWETLVFELLTLFILFLYFLVPDARHRPQRHLVEAYITTTATPRTTPIKTNFYFTYESCNDLDMFSVSNGLRTSSNWLCKYSVQFRIEIWNIRRRGSRSPKHAEFGHFTLLIFTRNGGKVISFAEKST